MWTSGVRPGREHDMSAARADPDLLARITEWVGDGALALAYLGYESHGSNGGTWPAPRTPTLGTATRAAGSCSLSATCTTCSPAATSTTPRHPLAFRNAADRTRYLDFTTAMTKALREALHQHAADLLAELGIDERLTWSPPAHLADSLRLPGVAVDDLDTTTITRLVVDEHRPVTDAARALGVHREHIRLALEHLDRPTRQWAINAAPSAWRTEQLAARLFTRDYLEREYIRNGRSLNELAADTGIGRHIIARIAKHHGVPLTNGRAPFPIDRDWLHHHYIDRLRSTADIAAELGTDQMVVNNALHRHGIPARPSGTGSFNHMLRRLDPSIPRDIRVAVEGALHGWQRLHRFHIAMAFPSLDTAAVYIGTHQSALVTQFQRLERDIGAALYQRGAHRKPHRPTRRGQTLISDLQRDHVRALMHAELPPEHAQPYPDRVTLAAAQQHADRARQPPRPTPITGIAVQRLRRTRTLLALLRDLLDNPDEFYGLQVHQRTGINEGTLYPLLHRLHSAGWLTSRPEDDQS